MAIGADGKYYGEAKVAPKLAKEIAEKREAQAKAAEDAKSKPKVDAKPEPDTNAPQVQVAKDDAKPVAGRPVVR